MSSLSGPVTKTRTHASSIVSIGKIHKKKVKELATYTHFEEILSRINPFGPYQIFACIFILLAQILWAGNTTFVNILGLVEPDWNCTFADGGHTIIKAPTNREKCDILNNQCASYKADKSSVDFYSILASFRMICDDNFKPETIQIIQASAMFGGSVVGGHLGDHLGRSTCFFISQLCLVITSVMTMAAISWQTYSICQFLFGFFYGVIEVTAMTMLMEMTNNRYRLIPNACFQWPLAYLSISLIAFLTKDWQLFFVFLNLVMTPVIIGFMLFSESPRWLVATNQLDRACDVLNDIAHERWNNARIKFTTRDLELIPREEKRPIFYNFYHLFSSRRLFKQSFIQILSMFTYSIVSITYMYSVFETEEDNAIFFTCLDGLFRIPMPILVILLDYKFPKFGRKLQFVLSLAATGLCYGAVVGMVAAGISYKHIAVKVCVIVGTMINDSAFWMNIIQITTQRYPTVIRCIAFGCLHSVKHVGTIVGVIIMQPLLSSKFPASTFIVPEALIIVTLFFGIFLQPESKGKALMDRMVEGNFGRFENEIPKALIRLAAGHRVAQVQVMRDLFEQHGEEWERKRQELAAANRSRANTRSRSRANTQTTQVTQF
ncbi:hypothetical protein QR680_006842 [Steinernema hermaphroditum]|uniref:Major facilitator superfamily (MFS) profile domain-containing protein n=1 Tax=Steinernema hermaphroditum TaxID=289476 RepID=A0AA39HWM7_9BILA|nr:hypothetical protein QR680_006842 [Steinernema hermaphroditum]